MDKVLTWFINCWVALVVLANVVSIVGSFVGAATFLGRMEADYGDV